MEKCSFSDIKNNIKYMLCNWWNWNKFSVFFCFIRIVSTICVTILYSLFPKIIIDCIEKSISFKKFILIVFIVAATVAIISIINAVSKEKVTVVADFTRMKYRVMALKKIMYTDYQNIESLSGRLQFEKGKDFAFRGRWSGSQDFYEIVVQMITSILGVFSYFVLLSFLKPEILIVLFITCIIEFFIMRKLSKLEINNRGCVVPIYLKIDYLFRTVISTKGIKDIKVYQAENWFKEIINELTCKCHAFMKQLTKQMITISALRMLVSIIRECIAYSFLIYAVVKREIELSDFVFYFGIVTGFSSWIVNMTNQLNSLERACNQCKEFRAFLELPEREFFDDKNIKIGQPNEIEFRNVSFKYEPNGEFVLKNISFKVKKGEKIALIGENGAGKTTLIKILCGLYIPTEGEVLVDGINVSKIPKEKYYDLFSAVFQDYSFLPQSIKVNISLMEDEKDIPQKKIEEVLEQVGLLERIKKLPQYINTNMVKQISKDAVQFSGGEEQRLLLARALYKNSPILILDEPTSALDPIAEDKIYKQYDSLMKNHTSFFVSHRISSTQFCDKIFFLENGEIKEVGTYSELLEKKGNYWNMYKMQCYYYN